LNTKCCTYYCGKFVMKNPKLYYNALGGGINMDAVILSCLDNFSKVWSLMTLLRWHEHAKKCSSETAAMISLWKCSSSDMKKK
jgi:hypothetical protein